MFKFTIYDSTKASAFFLLHIGVVEAPLCNQKTLWSPWHNPYLERLIGSVRRECLDHVIVLHERHLKQLLTQCMIYYHR
jgi:putative transposase